MRRVISANVTGEEMTKKNIGYSSAGMDPLGYQVSMYAAPDYLGHPWDQPATLPLNPISPEECKQAIQVFLNSEHTCDIYRDERGQIALVVIRQGDKEIVRLEDTGEHVVCKIAQQTFVHIDNDGIHG
jgi:hypothetical protein